MRTDKEDLTMSTPQPLAAMPTSAEGVDTALINGLLATTHPNVEVANVKVRRVWEWGQGEAVSTSGRIDLTLDYADPDCRLPREVVLKVARPELPAFPLYRNEVAVYSHVRPATFLNSPRCMGAWFDEPTGSFGLLLEDLTTVGAVFTSALSSIPVQSIESALRESAKLHARFWEAPHDGDLAWSQSHIEGELNELFNHPDLVPAMIEDEVANNQHKRELLQSVGQTPDQLLAQVQTVQHHQATLAPTLVHGDCHVGNHFLLPSGDMGLVDWQLSVRGHYMHDVSYLIVTGLDVETRRAEERRLIALHLDALREYGVTTLPTLDEAFDEYRRAQAWNTYIGWLTCPVENYGWEINVANHIRLLTAYRDLDTAQAVKDVQ